MLHICHAIIEADVEKFYNSEKIVQSLKYLKILEIFEEITIIISSNLIEILETWQHCCRVLSANSFTLRYCFLPHLHERPHRQITCVLRLNPREKRIPRISYNHKK